LIKPNLKFHWKQSASGDTGLKELTSHPNSILKFIETNPLLLLILLICIAGFFIFKDYFLFRKLYIFKDIGSDTYNQAYPLYVHMSDYLRSDGIPRWSFNVGMGQNIFAGGINEPFTLLLYAIGSKGIPYAIVYVEFLKILTGGILFFLYLRTMKISRYVSIVGALCFAFCGYMIIGTEWYNFSTFCVYIAFVLLAFEKFLMERKWYLLPVAIMFISSWFFMFYAFTLFFILYVIIRYHEVYNWNFRQFLYFSLKIAGFYILGMMLNCVVMLNGILQMLDSPRVSGDAGYFNVLKSTPVFGFGVKQHYVTALLRLFSNDLAGTGSYFRGWYNYLEAPIFYSGLISLLILPQLFVNGTKRPKIIYIAFFSLWFLIVLFPYFRHLFNLFSGDYYKVSISFNVTLMLIILSVKAFDSVIASGKINKTALIITLILLIGLLFIPFSGEMNKTIDKNLRLIIIGFLAADSLLLFFINHPKYRIWVKGFLIVSVIFELGYFAYIGTNKRYVESAAELKSKSGYNDYTIDAVKYLKQNDRGFYRINKNYFSGTSIHSTINDAQIQNYFGTPSYMSFNNVYYVNFLSETGVIHAKNEVETRWAQGLIVRPLLQTFGNIKYNLAKPGGFQFDFTVLGYEAIASFGDVTVYRNNLYLPFGYSYSKYITRSDFKKLDDLQKEFVLLRAFVINDEEEKDFSDLARFDIYKDTTKNYTILDYQTDIGNLRQNTLQLTKFTQNSFDGSIAMFQKKMLFFTIPYDKGWQLKVDGKKQKLYLVNIGFMGAVIPNGIHKIELRFEQPHLMPMILISLSGLLLYLLFLFIPGLNKFIKGAEELK
jgi:uncharacterized membrane protein YfhO